MNKNTDLRACKAKYLERQINKYKNEILIIIFIEHGPCFLGATFRLSLGCHKSLTLLNHLYFTLFKNKIIGTHFKDDKDRTQKSGFEQEA
jgi:hypothetical protein